jgi:4-amino-4-deoxychorismate lyase
MYLLNGCRKDSVDITDRGFQYGDGVFESLEIVNGQPLFLSRHLRRLALGCDRLLIPAPDPALLADEATTLCSGKTHAVLKIMVTRGPGGRGYGQPTHIKPTRLLGLYPFPDFPTCYQDSGVAVRFCNYRLSANPMLAGIKHMNRLEQILARAEWQDDSVQEGLLFDQNDRIIEGTMSNVFFLKDDVLYTPDLEQCGVAGIVREIIMESAIRLAIPLRLEAWEKLKALQADEIFLTNSVIGVWPVKTLEGRVFETRGLTKKLQAEYVRLRYEEV